MKEIGKNFNKILWEMLQKMLTTALFLLLGAVFGAAFTLAVLGITPQIFSEILSEYNPTPIYLAFMIIVVSATTVWQFTTMSSAATDDVVAV